MALETAREESYIPLRLHAFLLSSTSSCSSRIFSHSYASSNSVRDASDSHSVLGSTALMNSVAQQACSPGPEATLLPASTESVITAARCDWVPETGLSRP